MRERTGFLPRVNTVSTVESFQETRQIIWEKKIGGPLLSSTATHQHCVGFWWEHCLVRGRGVCLPLAQPDEWDEDSLRLPDVTGGILVSRASHFSTTLAPQGHQNAAI